MRIIYLYNIPMINSNIIHTINYTLYINYTLRVRLFELL